MNDENLIPTNKLTKSEQRALAIKAGKASGEARRRKKTLQECASAIKDAKITNEKVRDKLRSMGIADDDMTYGLWWTLSMSNEILNGNVAAFKEMRDAVGEAVLKVQDVGDSNPMTELAAAIRDYKKRSDKK